MPEVHSETPFRILSLDGGGAKGFYTLGVLKGIEGLLGGAKLCERFALVFGTSTGSIIAALICLGYSVDEIHAVYQDHVIKIISKWFPWTKATALDELSAKVFKDTQFSSLKTNIGIVATRWAFETPIIFKSHADQAHGDKGNFVPGFGCSLAEAVVASCSAFPFFSKKTVSTSGGERVLLVDGGFCANNPTLYAIADATEGFGIPHTDIRVVSVGVGKYPSPRRFHTLYVH